VLEDLVEFLLRDEFTTPDDAPITSPRTCEPGPGTLTSQDTADVMAISGGEIVPNAATTANADPAIYDSIARARAAGLSLIISIRNYLALGISNNCIRFGWDVSPTTHFDLYGVALNVGSRDHLCIDGGLKEQIDTYTDNVFKEYAVIQRDSGFFVVALASNKLLWVDDSDTATPVYAVAQAVNPGRAPFGLDYFKVAQLAAPWDTDNGIATDVKAGVVAEGTTFTHEADCLIDFVVTTLTTGAAQKLYFRTQDSSNGWELWIENSGQIKLYEQVAGGRTARGSKLGAVVDGERIVIICDDETISVYDNNVLSFSYASAANFKTETSGELEQAGPDGLVSDLITWPRTLSGSALTALEDYTT